MRSLDASTPEIDPVVGVLDYWITGNSLSSCYVK